MLTHSQIAETIEKTLISIWENEIYEDYQRHWLVREDTLKNALYFHLRNKLETLFSDYNIRIFTEFTGSEFRQNGFKPDMVIAQVDLDYDGSDWRDSVIEYLAVIEMKSLKGFYSRHQIYADFQKFEQYASNPDIQSHFYMATIWEYWDDATAWIEGEDSWATGKVTELNASYLPNSDYEMRFYHISH